jgi:hypothetical protein
LVVAEEANGGAMLQKGLVDPTLIQKLVRLVKEAQMRVPVTSEVLSDTKHIWEYLDKMKGKAISSSSVPGNVESTRVEFSAVAASAKWGAGMSILVSPI